MELSKINESIMEHGKLEVPIYISNAQEYEALLDDVKEKYYELQMAISRLSRFKLEYKIQ